MYGKKHFVLSATIIISVLTILYAYPAFTQNIQTVTVTNIEELLGAIQSDIIIQLEPDEYNISEAEEYENEHIRWEEVYDGYMPIIENVENMKITGLEDGAEIVIEPRMAWVLTFIECSDITFDNVSIGHTKTSECYGGVADMVKCSTMKFNNCDLYGSGTYAMRMENTFGIPITGCRIYDCTEGILICNDVTDLVCENTEFTDNDGYWMIELNGVAGTIFENCTFEDNEGDVMFYFELEGSPIELTACEFLDNEVGMFTNLESGIKIDSNTEFSDNDFDK